MNRTKVDVIHILVKSGVYKISKLSDQYVGMCVISFDGCGDEQINTGLSTEDYPLLKKAKIGDSVVVVSTGKKVLNVFFKEDLEVKW